HFNYPALAVDVVVSFIGNGTAHLVKKSIEDTDIEFEEAMKVNRQKYSNALSVHTIFYPGTFDLLKFLHEQKIPVAITSNKPTDWCKTIANDMGFAEYVSVIYGGSKDYALKPEPDMLQLASKEMGIELSQALMIGDNWTDVDAGIAAGCETAYFRNGLGELKENQADFKYSEVADLKQWLITKLGL
ncbi:MAG: HAD-IA family hydrolase, partial [Lentisphaeria bacterium]|nr:HAD-IA family hydrolase [Lentisphaeria bacterium]